MGDVSLSFSVIARIGVHRGVITGIAADPAASRLMVTNHADNSVSSIDTDTYTHGRTVVGTNEPFAIALAGTRAYVSTVSAAYDAIVVIDVNTGRVVGVHPVAHSVRDLAVSPDGRHVYACRTAVHGADVAVLDTMTGRVDSIGLAAGDHGTGATTECVRVSPDGARCYVATDGASGAELAVIDTHQQRVVGAVRIGSPIRDVALHPHGDAAYIVSCGPDSGAVLDVVDTRTNMVTGTAKIGEVSGLGTQLSVSGDGERAYLVGDESVVVLSTHSHDVIGTIAVGCRPSCVMESPDGNHLYIGDYAGTVSVIAIHPADADTAAHDWTLPELLALEPAMA
ncbi:YncE family protein [Mycobacterium sp.]|uniref:YncE family protein n=1 Tax=Mycobacterium sp. TaxID=1785 RepID=UPI003D6C1D0F